VSLCSVTRIFRTVLCCAAGLLVCAPVYAQPYARLNPALVSKNVFVYPVMGPRLSSDFGVRAHPIMKVTRHHHGVDLAAPAGSLIRSIAGGQVIYADPHGGYGRFIVVRHANGLSSHYGHCQQVNVRIGQKVNAGDILGTVGSSGRSTGPHLHFEVRREGKPLDPNEILPGLSERAEG
jgi:murein DD-endopeptidase MepM/ murein hydrolase activator NlpD